MQRKQRFAFYCTLTVPIAVAAGLAVGRSIGFETVPVVIGLVAGSFAAAAMVGRRQPTGSERGRGIQRR